MTVLVINAVNADAIVARTNLDRMRGGENFDAYYLNCLSADAVPVIVEAMPGMREADRRTVEDSIEPPAGPKPTPIGAPGTSAGTAPGTPWRSTSPRSVLGPIANPVRNVNIS